MVLLLLVFREGEGGSVGIRDGIFSRPRIVFARGVAFVLGEFFKDNEGRSLVEAEVIAVAARCLVDSAVDRNRSAVVAGVTVVGDLKV